MTDHTDPAFVDHLVAWSADQPVIDGIDGVVGFAVKKKAGVVVEIADGRVIGPSTDDAASMVVFADQDQLEAWVSGELDLAVAYMRGDFKPTGPLRPLLPFIGP